MLKGMLFTTALFFWLIAIFILTFFKYEKDIPFRKGIINKNSTSIGLRESANEDLPYISRLLPGEFAPLITEGKRWVYIRKANREYAIPKKVVSLNNIQLFYLFVFEESNYQATKKLIKEYRSWLYYLSLLGVAIFFLKIMRELFIRVRNFLKNQRNTINNDVFSESELHFTQTQLNDAVSRVIKSEQEKHKKSLSELKKQLTQDLSYSIRKELQGEYDLDLQAYKKDIKQLLIEEYREELSEEINIEYLGIIEDMERATKKMREEFERKKAKAKILGVDLDDTELDNLVKGREFEIYCARIFSQHPRLSIKRWTPDKGIKENIPVENNGDPDFLLEIKSINDVSYIAIECKYASSWNYKKAPTVKYFNCVKYYQYIRYMEFQNNENIRVLMLVGVDLPASKPQSLYLFDLFDLKSKENFDYDDRKGYDRYYANKDASIYFSLSEDALCGAVLAQEKAFVS